MIKSSSLLFLDSKQISMVRGLAIIGVVAIHLIDSLLRRDTFHTLSPFTQWFSLVVYELSLLGVPLFIFLSALVFNPKHLQSLDTYLVKRLGKLIPPYLIWTLLYVFVYAGSYGKISLEQLHTFFLFGWSSLYFIILMIQFTFLAPLTYIISQKKSVLIGVLIFQLLLLADFYFNTVLNERTTFQIQHLFSFCLFWLGYFCLGAYLAVKKVQYHFLLPLLVFLGSFFFVMRDVVSLFIQKNMPSVLALSYFRPSVFFMCLSVIFLLPYLLKLIPKYVDTVLVKIGQLSYGIFLTHLFVMKFVLVVLKVNRENVFGLITALALVVFLSSVITYLVMRVPYLSLAFGELKTIPIFKKKTQPADS